MLIIRNLNLINVQSWTYIYARDAFIVTLNALVRFQNG